MANLPVDNKKVLDFSPQYQKKQIDDIKRKFSNVCKNDPTLSDEYKKHIQTLSNINVGFYPVYGFDAFIDFNYISVDYSFEYTLTYQTGTHITGKVTFDSYGDGHISDMQTHKEYESSRTTSEGQRTWYSTAMNKCELHLGAAANTGYNTNIRNYVDVTDAPPSELPYGLRKLSNRPLTYDDLNPYIRKLVLPSRIHNEIKQDVTKSYSSPTNFRMSVRDYFANEINVTILPYTYKFDVWTEFNGKIYGLKNVDSISNIVSEGPESNHHHDYQREVEKQSQIFSSGKMPHKRIYFIAALLPIIMVILIAGMLIFAKTIKHEAIIRYYHWETVGLLAVMFVFMIISIRLTKKVRVLHIPESDYNQSQSLSNLYRKIDLRFYEQKRKATSSAIAWLIAITVVTAAVGVGAYTIYSKTYMEHFLYTPEILGEYCGESEGVYGKLTIISCSNEGHIVVQEESTYRECYAKAIYEGQITNKRKNRITVNLELVEVLHKPDMGSFPKTLYLGFIDGGNAISGYFDSEDLLQKNSTVFTKEHYTPEIENTYIQYRSGNANIININSCGNDGKIDATYTFASKSGYGKYKMSGEVILKKSNNDMFVRLDVAQTIEEQQATPDITGSVVACISNNFTNITIGKIAMSTDPGNVDFIRTTSDLEKIASSSSLIILMNDIDFQGRTISPINKFGGSIIGNGHSIKNYRLTEKVGYYVGLIVNPNSGSFILDVKIENAHLETTEKGTYAGLLISNWYGGLFNVSASGTVTAPSFKHVGGIVGYAGGQTSGLTSAVKVEGGENASPTIGNKN
ncbi:MAG: hypothetical protein E7667_03430 [Ruminococcaceae bacterium]|nr:hypothetical protein [Oscillospiraceae bacterium]